MPDQTVGGLVTNDPQGVFGNNSTQTIALGRSAEQLVAQTHGKFYTPCLGGNIFVLSTAVAGTTIPVQATNLVSTFTLLNPLNSGVNLELIRYELGILNATTVVADISLYYQVGVGSTIAALTSTTALAIRSSFTGAGSNSQALGYSAATFTNTVGTNLFRLVNLATFGAVTTTTASSIFKEFDGTIILAPGTAVTVAGSAAQTQAMTQGLMWAEWPV